MRLNWRGEIFPVTQLNLMPGYIYVGDYVLHNGEPMKVITVQPNCPHIENLHKKFTMFTLESRAGQIVPVPNLGERSTVFRVKKVKVSVP